MKNNKISECLTFLYKHYIALIFSILVGIFIFTSCFTDQAYLCLSIESKSPVNFSLYDQHGDLKSLDDFSGKIILNIFILMGSQLLRLIHIQYNKIIFG